MSEDEVKSWRITIQVEGVDVEFKMDTGAEVTAISEETFRGLGGSTLTHPEKRLYGPSRVPLKVLGKFNGQLRYKDGFAVQPIFVVSDLKTNLLGLPAITALNLAVRIDSMESTKKEILEEFPDVFTGLGNFKAEYEIKLKDGALPYSILTPRSVPLPLRQKTKEELDRMESIGVIKRVDEATPWCAGMVVVPKKNGTVRICVDLQALNQSVMRELHPLPTVDDLLAQIQGACVFSKLDANSGFWQIPLAKKSQLLTTFLTPYGRYCFRKLPFGISSGPEHFQKRMSRILEGMEGVLCLIDDALVFGKNQEEHDARLREAIQRIHKAGVTLNPSKCEFRKSSIIFAGNLIDKHGIRPDPGKTAALDEMKPPKTTTELRRFLGMANQLGKFSPNLAELTQPLRELLKKRNSWCWGSRQDQAFQLVKTELTKPTVLATYDPAAETKVSADASSFGLGAVLLQKKREQWKPIAYASRSMSETEGRYAQIEKEALAITWACERFTSYILGKQINIETDHKPLVSLLGEKDLDKLPPRILRFRLRLARFQYSICHVPGKSLYTADALSRSPVSMPEDITLQEEADALMEMCVTQLPAGTQRLKEYSIAQSADSVCQRVMHYCRRGWPNKRDIESSVTPYWKMRGELTIGGNLLLYRRRIVVPQSLQQQTLQKLHEGHQGIQKCRLRAQISVWWPGLSSRINDMVKACPVCSKNFSVRREPMMPGKLPDRPWQKVGSDLFNLNGSTYLIVVDYYSRWPEVVKLSTTTSKGVIDALKSIFSRHGIPQVLMSDNGPQYASQEFANFARTYDFSHISSSPHFPQSNGLAERAVQTVKSLLRNSADPYLALLTYRSTPLAWCNISPAELLMGRQIRTNLPQLDEQLCPRWPDLEEFRRKDQEYKQRQKQDFDRRHRSQALPSFPEDTEVWIKTDNETVPGRVVATAPTPRSYMVETPGGGQLQRNRAHLNYRPCVMPSRSPPTRIPIPPVTQPSPGSTLPSPTTPPTPKRIMTRSRTGKTVGQPNRYEPSWASTRGRKGDVA